MANTVKLKQSAVAGKVPATTDLALGELAVNTYDGKLFLKKKVGTTETVVDVSAAAAGVSSFNGRTGAVTPTSSDVTGALGYTPVNKAGDTITGTINNIHSSGRKLFKTANNIYETANFGPRPANDGICSVTFEYDAAGNWWKFDATGSQFEIIGVDYSEFRIRRSDGFVAIGKSLEPTQKLDVDGNVYARGAFLGQGSFVCSFTDSINANTNRAPGVYGSYASSATNTPTNSGILWNGMSGINGDGQYDGGQFWQDYYSGAFYHRRRWGGGWSAWYYVGG